MSFKARAVLFDMDGTIVDTEASAVKAVQDVFQEWGIQLDPADGRVVVGKKWDAAFEFLFSKYKPGVSIEEARNKILGQYFRAIEEKVETVPGSIEAIQKIGSLVPIGLVTGSSRSQINTVFSHLDIERFFQVVLGAEDYYQSKPSPEGFLKASEILQVAPKDILVFEDSEAGIESGKSAGMHVVAITGSHHFPQNTSKADQRIANFKEISEDWMRTYLSID